jgi:hypothetical protein
MHFRDYLRRERLFTDEPYKQDQLRPKEKLRERPQSVIFDNVYRSAKQKIFCHVCGSHRHRNGITGLLVGGDRILFGSTCAKEFFGADVMLRCAGELRSKTKKAHDRFLILDVANSIEPVETWISSYKSTVFHVERAWTDIYLRYEAPVSELMNHLQRNRGRLLRSEIKSVGGNAMKQHDFEHKTIITHISEPEAISNLRKISQRVTLVEQFIYAVKSVKCEPSDQLFTNLSSMYFKTMNAATEIDACLLFTKDFFQKAKLTMVGAWLEERRKTRLSDLTAVTRQDLSYKFVKIMGSGVEAPPSLAASLSSTDIPGKLSSRSSPSRIEQVS